VETNNDDDDYLQDKSETEENYEDDDFDENDDKKKASTTSSTPEEPYITHEHTEKADVGKEITLKCHGVNVGSAGVIMWYNDTTILKQGEAVITKDKRISFNKDGAMTIASLSSYDSGEFRCRSFYGKERHETKIQLSINGPPRGIKIGHNLNTQSNVSDMTFDYKAGLKDLRFKCNVAKGLPHPKLEWIHNGNTILESQHKDNEIKIDDEGVLIIRSLHAKHAGEYQCEASNEFGTVKSSFKINVECKFAFFLFLIG
jgi:Immunoglobulin I-set domain